MQRGRGGAGRRPKGDNTALKTRGLHGLAGFGQGRDQVMKGDVRLDSASFEAGSSRGTVALISGEAKIHQVGLPSHVAAMNISVAVIHERAMTQSTVRDGNWQRASMQWRSDCRVVAPHERMFEAPS